jgi:hypothetical protein
MQDTIAIWKSPISSADPLSVLLATHRVIPVPGNTTFDDLRDVSPMLAARSGLSTGESSMRDVTSKVAAAAAAEGKRLRRSWAAEGVTSVSSLFRAGDRDQTRSLCAHLLRARVTDTHPNLPRSARERVALTCPEARSRVLLLHWSCVFGPVCARSLQRRKVLLYARSGDSSPGH